MRTDVPRKRHPFRKALFICIGIFLFFAVSVIVFLGYVGIRAGGNILIENKAPSFFSGIERLTSLLTDPKRSLLRGETDGRINILLLGRAGERYPGRNLTDTVMVMSIDTRVKKVSLLSLPRDLYAPIPDTDLSTKINSLYQYGLGTGQSIDPLRKSVEEITGQNIHYFALVDFDGFEQIVDALGGIRIDVVRDFSDTRYPGKHYNYETFEIKKGWQTLDGATALKYVRERHDDPEGDFGRAKRQQQTLQAIKEKFFSTRTLLNVFTLRTLLETLGESVKTDIPPEDIRGFLELARTVDTKNVTTVVIDAWKKESLLRVSHVQVGPTAAFILVPRIGNWSEIQDVAENIFRLDTLREREEKIALEQPALSVLFAPSDSLAAKRFVTALTSTLSAASTISLQPSLESRPKRSIISDRNGLKKPFSLDELIRRFGLEQSSSLPTNILLPANADFVILLGEDIIDSLDFEETAGIDVLENDAFQEALPPQQKKPKP